MATDEPQDGWPIASRADLALVLLYLRSFASLRQEDVAQAMCVPQQYISRWERGDMVPRLEGLIDLLDCFDCEVVVRRKASP